MTRLDKNMTMPRPNDKPEWQANDKQMINQTNRERILQYFCK